MNHRRFLFLTLLLAVVSFALLMPYIRGVYGVSLDDAYIFFVYARNLAAGDGWAFNPGVTSFGASSVLWTLMLAVPARLQLDLVQASRVMSAALFGLSTLLLVLTIHRLTHDRVIALLVGAIFAVTQQITLITLTGMDVINHIALLLGVAYLLSRWQMRRPFWLGVLAGLAFLSRPDALIVLPILLGSWLLLELATARPAAERGRRLLRVWARAVAGWALPVLPWLTFLYSRTGALVPLSYRAKLLSMPGAPETMYYAPLERLRVAIDYATNGVVDLFDFPGLLQFWLIATLAGAATLGLVISLLPLFRQGTEQDKAQDAARERLLPLLFLWGVVVLLPLEYGWKDSWWYGGYLLRYVLPVLPLSIVLAAVGLHQTLAWLRAGLAAALSDSRLSVFAVRILSLAVYGLLAAGVFFHARTYWQAHDWRMNHYATAVAQNEDYRREVAAWLRDNTEEDARIADSFLGVGAIGYYAQRYTVDGGGLADSRLLDYWAQDGNPVASFTETLAFFEDEGVSYIVGGTAMQEWLGERGEPVATITNRGAEMNWAETDFDTTIIYRLR